jgi:hypothetical protein
VRQVNGNYQVDVPRLIYSISEAHLHLTLPNSILGPIPAIFPTQNAPRPCYAASKVSGYTIDSLTKPRTPKQLTRAFLRWRATANGSASDG